MEAVHAFYYTDPACPWSWALEPVTRKLSYQLDGSISIQYVMCGMAREFGDPVELIGELLEAGESSGMPVDPRLWLQDPPRSSHPACIAVKAAAEQGDPGPYLRRLREGFQCRRRKLDSTEALVDEARATGGLEIDRFRVDLGSHATLEAFGADLERAADERLAEHRSPKTGRVKLPSLEFVSDGGDVHGVYGPSDYESVKRAAMAAGSESKGRRKLRSTSGIGWTLKFTTAMAASVPNDPIMSLAMSRPASLAAASARALSAWPRPPSSF